MSHRSLAYWLAGLACVLSPAAWGQEMARVVSTTPVIQTVSVTELMCTSVGSSPATCTQTTQLQNRITHYNVVYEYGGKTYGASLAQDPGQWLPISVTPVVEAVVPAIPPTVWVTAPAPTAVVVAPYPYVYAPVYRPYPFSMHFGFYGGRGFRHWR